MGKLFKYIKVGDTYNVINNGETLVSLTMVHKFGDKVQFCIEADNTYEIHRTHCDWAKEYNENRKQKALDKKYNGNR